MNMGLIRLILVGILMEIMLVQGDGGDRNWRTLDSAELTVDKQDPDPVLQSEEDPMKYRVVRHHGERIYKKRRTTTEKTTTQPQMATVAGRNLKAGVLASETTINPPTTEGKNCPKNSTEGNNDMTGKAGGVVASNTGTGRGLLSASGNKKNESTHKRRNGVITEIVDNDDEETTPEKTNSTVGYGHLDRAPMGRAFDFDSDPNVKTDGGQNSKKMTEDPGDVVKPEVGFPSNEGKRSKSITTVRNREDDEPATDITLPEIFTTMDDKKDTLLHIVQTSSKLTCPTLQDFMIDSNVFWMDFKQAIGWKVEHGLAKDTIIVSVDSLGRCLSKIGSDIVKMFRANSNSVGEEYKEIQDDGTPLKTIPPSFPKNK